jgi:Mn-dependent DtxR family transcriptional regulator
MELHSKLQSESQRLELRNMENNTGKTWTAEELQSVRMLYTQNVPVVEIAQRLGRSYMAIVSRLQRLGLMDRLGNRILKLNEKGGAQ